MKSFNLAAIGLVFTAMFTVSAMAQTAAVQSTTGNIGLVNTNAFADEKAGITKFKAALAALNAEFKIVSDELNNLSARHDALAAEIQNLQKSNATVPVNQATLQAKADEYAEIEKTIKRKQEDAKAKYDKRYEQVVGPIYGDILKAMNEYARSKGYALILDGVKLEEQNILMGFDDKFDVTKDFIVFYNARTPSTATTAAPK